MTKENASSASSVQVSHLVWQVFDKLDAGDARAFAALLDEECISSFGNIGPVEGREAVQAGIEQLYQEVVAKQSHNVLHEWAVGLDHVVELEVTYTRHDGRVLTLPAVTIMTLNDKGFIRSYRIYIDQSPLFAA